jgi:carbon-monoxide dehydrogenase medium subunit
MASTTTAGASWAREHALHRATSLEEAVSTLAGLGADGAALAGGTWIMRAPIRREQMKGTYVALTDIPELRRRDRERLGALLTHRELETEPGALGEAARGSGPPAVRNVATLGGSVCASPFPESDLVPALLVLDAALVLASPSGEALVRLADYLPARASRPAGELVTAVALGAAGSWASAFERLTVRHGDEYAVANVAVSLELGADGAVTDARVAVGCVEQQARRVPEAERALVGQRADAAAGDAAGHAAAAALAARDGGDAPGWYRTAVLPPLVRRAGVRLAPTTAR